MKHRELFEFVVGVVYGEFIILAGVKSRPVVDTGVMVYIPLFRIFLFSLHFVSNARRSLVLRRDDK